MCLFPIAVEKYNYWICTLVTIIFCLFVFCLFLEDVFVPSTGDQCTNSSILYNWHRIKLQQKGVSHKLSSTIGWYNESLQGMVGEHPQTQATFLAVVHGSQFKGEKMYLLPEHAFTNMTSIPSGTVLRTEKAVVQEICCSHARIQTPSAKAPAN